MDIDLTDHAREAVAAALRERGIETFEILVRAPLLNHPAGNEALLVRLPDMAPEIHFVRIPDRDWRTAADPEAILREASETYDHAQRRIADLLRRYANERDRAGIEAVLRQQAAGELTREQAAEALGLKHWSDLFKLEREFGIHGNPRMIDAAEDMMHDIEAMDAEDDAQRRSGSVPMSDHYLIESMRARGKDDDAIKDFLRIDRAVVLPTAEEIERRTERLVYGLDRDAPMLGATVTVAMGTKMARVVVRGTDGEEVTRVAHARWVGRNAGHAIDEALDRLRLKGDLPGIPSW